MKIPDIKIDVEENTNIKPSNAKTPAFVPLHLRTAANEELKNLIKSWVLEECHSQTEWCSRGIFVPKNSDDGNLKCRLVADFKNINKILRRPGYPMEGRSALLKRIPSENKFFSTIYRSSG